MWYCHISKIEIITGSGVKDLKQASLIQLTRLVIHSLLIFTWHMRECRKNSFVSELTDLYFHVSLCLSASPYWYHTNCYVVIPPVSRKYPANIVCHVQYVV